MFTGLVEQMGVISRVDAIDVSERGGTSLTITQCPLIVDDTLKLGELLKGQKLNLERAMSGNSRFGGHFVQGHVDCTIKIISIKPDPPNSVIYTFLVDPPGSPEVADFLTYIVPKGYVTLDGTSLTVIDVDWETRSFSIMLIAYTQSKVIMTGKQVGDSVNLEVDQMGKYVENVVKGMIKAGDGPIHALVRNIVQQNNDIL